MFIAMRPFEDIQALIENMRAFKSHPPIIRIANGTFYRHHPNATSSHPNLPLFSELTFELPSQSSSPHNWCVVGPSLSARAPFFISSGVSI